MTAPIETGKSYEPAELEKMGYHLTGIYIFGEDTAKRFGKGNGIRIERGNEVFVAVDDDGLLKILAGRDRQTGEFRRISFRD